MSTAVKRVEIEAQKQLKVLLREHFLDLDRAAHDTNRKVAWCTSVGPCEILTAFGFEVLLEIPGRFGVGDHIADAQAEEAFEARAVKDLLLGGVVALAVEPLPHEDFEHEHGVEGGHPFSSCAWRSL